MLSKKPIPRVKAEYCAACEESVSDSKFNWIDNRIKVNENSRLMSNNAI